MSVEVRQVVPAALSGDLGWRRAGDHGDARPRSPERPRHPTGQAAPIPSRPPGNASPRGTAPDRPRRARSPRYSPRHRRQPAPPAGSPRAHHQRIQLAGQPKPVFRDLPASPKPVANYVSSPTAPAGARRATARPWLNPLRVRDVSQGAEYLALELTDRSSPAATASRQPLMRRRTERGSSNATRAITGLRRLAARRTPLTLSALGHR